MNTIEIARKAGLATSDRGRPNGYAEYCKRLEQFARLVAEAERERYAKVCDTLAAERATYLESDGCAPNVGPWVPLDCANAIRALEDE